jgi:hypothetical protein
MLADIKSINKPFIINGIGGKSLVVDKVGIAGRFGKTFYNIEAKANILSYTSIIDMGYKINYSTKNDEFIVQINSNKSYTFRRNGGYYIFNARHIFEDNNSTSSNNTAITTENNSNNDNISTNNNNQLDNASIICDNSLNNNEICENYRGTTLSKEKQLSSPISNQHSEEYDIIKEHTQPKVINDQGETVVQVFTYLAAASKNINCKVENSKVQTKQNGSINQSSLFPSKTKTIKTVSQHPNHHPNYHHSFQSNSSKKLVRFTKRVPPDINPRFKSSTLLTNQE